MKIRKILPTIDMRGRSDVAVFVHVSVDTDGKEFIRIQDRVAQFHSIDNFLNHPTIHNLPSIAILFEIEVENEVLDCFDPCLLGSGELSYKRSVLEESRNFGCCWWIGGRFAYPGATIFCRKYPSHQGRIRSNRSWIQTDHGLVE